MCVCVWGGGGGGGGEEYLLECSVTCAFQCKWSWSATLTTVRHAQHATSHTASALSHLCE